MPQNQSSQPSNATTNPPQQSQQPGNAVSQSDAAKMLVRISNPERLSYTPEFTIRMELRAVAFITKLDDAGLYANFYSALEDYNTIHHDLVIFFLRAIKDLANANRLELVHDLTVFMPKGWETHFLRLDDATYVYTLRALNYEWKIYGRFPRSRSPDIIWEDWIEEGALRKD